ncbi:arginase family protein [Microbacterium sp.]|uniref:arginase family protein n=1 Tax=Microbacterium sp. TaxID=51671 RepID=UPI003C75AF6C
MTRFLVVPQWQGSGAPRAMLLQGGAQAIAGDLPRSASVTVDVPLEAGEEQGTGIHRFSTLPRIQRLVAEALAQSHEPTIVVGGDCSVSVAPIGVAARRHPGLAVVWFDAHGDLNTPESSTSGAFHGMPLRAVLGDGHPELALEPGLVTPDRVVHVGGRDFDDPEVEFLRDAGIRVVSASELSQPDAIAAAVRATGAAHVYIHVDLDVLDPAAIAGVSYPVPFGPSAAELVTAIKAVRATAMLVGGTIAEFAPASPAAAVDDLGTILRVVGALA